MRACSECFKSDSWVSNASPPDASAGTCDFCHHYATETYPTSAWYDSFSELLNLYEESSEVGQPLANQLQNDWGIFAFDDAAQILEFVRSAGLTSDPLLAGSVNVILRRSFNGTPTDHVTAWERFSNEIRTENRYFPNTVPAKDTLERAFAPAVAELSADSPLYRARICDGEAPFPARQMGAPPPNFAAAGRANPIGIPYLYLAFEEATCINETRPAAHSRLCVGTFKLRESLRVLSLSDVAPLDYFDVAAVDDIDEQIQRILFHRYLQTLGDELSKPVRRGDLPTEYIPTQFLCEAAKSFGLGGVVYGSSVSPGGNNIVLFDVDAAVCGDLVALVDVTSVKVDYTVVPRIARKVARRARRKQPPTA